jgi:pyridoxamine 5'-phosphate oxidase
MDHMRRTYKRHKLDREQLLDDPIAQFQLWFSEAGEATHPEWLEINAMTLSTCDLNGHVWSRIVLLKAVDERGFTFFTNYHSAKGQQIAANPRAALLLYWPHIERQVRVEGIVEKTESDISDAYFQSRPRGSQIGAIISPQSQVVHDYHSLEIMAAEKEQEFSNQTLPRPDHWGGYRLKPTRLEFLHDRFIYSRDSAANHWQIGRIAP